MSDFSTQINTSVNGDEYFSPLKHKSKTFEGIAKAFASQWGGNVE